MSALHILNYSPESIYTQCIIVLRRAAEKTAQLRGCVSYVVLNPVADSENHVLPYGDDNFKFT